MTAGPSQFARTSDSAAARLWTLVVVAAVALTGCPANPADVVLRDDVDGGDMPPPPPVPDSGPSVDAPIEPPVDANPVDAPNPIDAPLIDGGRPMIDAPGPSLTLYGWPSEFTGQDDYLGDLLVFQPISITSEGTLERFGVITKGQAGTSAVLGLYRDSGGAPSTLLVQTPIFTSATGVNEVAPESAVTIPPGNYWTVVHFATTTVLATSPDINDNGYFADISFSDGLPATLAGTTSTILPAFNVYISVQE